jgi:hypothetical protein
MELSELMAKHAKQVTELQFGPKIKVARHTDGWRIIVLAPAGCYVANLSDGFLYRDDSTKYKNPEFFSQDVEKVIEQAKLIMINLGHEQQVTNPECGFISKFLNPTSTGRLLAVWKEEGIEHKTS